MHLKPKGKVVAALVWCLGVGACGEPSPWSQVIWGGRGDLTQAELDRLGSGTGTFTPFQVGLIADTQHSPGYFREVVDRLDAREGLSFYLVMGDLTHRSLKQEFEWVADVVRDSARPILTVVGNHDGLLYGSEIYQQLFGPLEYTFVFNGVKFIMWNDNPQWGRPDIAWLLAQVQSYDRVVIVSHQPPGRVDWYEAVNDRLKEIIAHPHVLASVHGHTHKTDLQIFGGNPAYTVAAVQGGRYGTISFNGDLGGDLGGDSTTINIKMEQCKNAQCQPLDKP